jgi:NAD(P)-dependent dehydrogenase (short-subunit alcohol dehydrogenase family)
LGLGLVAEYLARGWQVIATIRSDSIPEGLKQMLSAHTDRLRVEQADINRSESIEVLKESIGPGELDLLFVNAGISRGPEDNASTVSSEDFIDLMMTNALSPLRAVTSLHDRLKPGGAVAVMSSNLASISNNVTGKWEVYRASKASLNTFIRSYAARHPDDTLTYLCISPGWVRTDMGGDNAPLDVATSVQGIVNTVQARKGSAGVHYIDYLNAPIQW